MLLRTLETQYSHLLGDSSQGSTSLAPSDLSLRSIERSYRRSTRILHPDRTRAAIADEAQEVLKVLTRSHADSSSWFSGLLDAEKGGATKLPAKPCDFSRGTRSKPAYHSGMDGHDDVYGASESDDDDIFTTFGASLNAHRGKEALSSSPAAHKKNEDIGAQDHESGSPDAPISQEEALTKAEVVLSPPVTPMRTTEATPAQVHQDEEEPRVHACSAGDAALRRRVVELEASVERERRERAHMEETLSAAYQGLIRELMATNDKLSEEAKVLRGVIQSMGETSVVERRAEDEQLKQDGALRSKRNEVELERCVTLDGADSRLDSSSSSAHPKNEPKERHCSSDDDTFDESSIRTSVDRNAQRRAGSTPKGRRAGAAPTVMPLNLSMD